MVACTRRPTIMDVGTGGLLEFITSRAAWRLHLRKNKNLRLGLSYSSGIQDLSGMCETLGSMGAAEKLARLVCGHLLEVAMDLETLALSFL